MQKDSIKNIQNQIFNILKKNRSFRSKDFKYNNNIVEDSGLDSFEIMSFIIEIESFYSISFNPEDLLHEEMHSIEGLAKYIKSN